MSAFDLLASADWRGVMALDADPREEPAIPEKVEEPDWRDLVFDARKSLNAADRCDRHRDRSRNLLAAREQIDAALLLLLGPSL